MKKLLQLGLILAGSVALSFTMVNATCGSGKEAPKIMKCESGKCNIGKCGTDKNKTKPETNTTKPAPVKPAPEKGKCGVGKCS